MPPNYVRIYLYLYLYSTTLALIHSRVIDVVESIILEWTIEASSVIRSQGQLLLQAADKVRVADVVPAIDHTIILAGLDHSPGVLFIPPTTREEGGGAEDPTEAIEGNVCETPALEELVLSFNIEDLLIALTQLAGEIRQK
jgi:hypothetical protein